MTDEKHQREGQAGTPAKLPKQESHKDPGNDSKQHRLKLALRANLKRRKSQARARGDRGAAPSHGDEASPYDESEKKRSE
jgi:hypothetical protein